MIKLLGINHKTAPIEVREKFYLTETERDLVLSELKSHPKIVEAFVLSTCNRTELYVHTIDQLFNLNDFIELLLNVKKINPTIKLDQYFYQFTNKDALRHLFQVTCGLDSLVLGERQILGQVRKAFERAQEKGFFSKTFNITANLSIRTAKKVQSETMIGFGGSSVSWAAIATAERELGDLKNKRVLIIGAGKMSKLAVGQISNLGFKELYLMNRTPEKAENLAEKFNGTHVSFFDLKETLSKVDLCICSVSAPHYILDREMVETVMPLRDSRKLLFIDISMPRNIAPDIATIENTKLYYIDDLDNVVEENLLKRKEAVKKVHRIIEDKLKDLYDRFEKINKLTANEVPLIVDN